MTQQKYYDLLYTAQGKNYQAETEALAGFIRSHCPHAKTVLDVGCGTGRHARILSDRFNLEVDGIDIDPNMIEVARKENPKGTFSVDDMTSFGTGKKYDVILSMFSAIAYVRTLQNVTKALTCFKDHIKSDGIIILEPWLTPDNFTGGRTFMDVAEDGSTKVCRMAYNEKNGNISRLNFHWTICTPKGVETFDEKYDLGLFTVDEMVSCFKTSGLKPIYDPAPGCFANRGIYIATP